MKAVADGKKRSSSGKFVKKTHLVVPVNLGEPLEEPWRCTDEFNTALA